MTAYIVFCRPIIKMAHMELLLGHMQGWSTLEIRPCLPCVIHLGAGRLSWHSSGFHGIFMIEHSLLEGRASGEKCLTHLNVAILENSTWHLVETWKMAQGLFVIDCHSFTWLKPGKQLLL